MACFAIPNPYNEAFAVQETQLKRISLAFQLLVRLFVVRCVQYQLLPHLVLRPVRFKMKRISARKIQSQLWMGSS